MLKMQGVFKYYISKYRREYILRDIDLEVQKGEFVTVMGPSGAGKSTLLYLLGMLESIDDGEYLYKDIPIHSFNDKKRTEIHKHEIGFVFQQYHLIDELTVYENIEIPLLYKKVKSPERKSLVCDILDKFNIVAKKDLFPNQLSGGQQQLVGICRAIIGKPDLLLADEPTGNLNSEQGLEIMEVLKKMNQHGTTIIQVTHSREKAAFGNRIVNLLDGMIQADQ
ncbi:MAG: ABC transporter ATP-binding protein [Candidatus Cloacimonetes bacterium]|nr:ABC transporter ATP-binding protein [Candidatus Cloacimonadota bacterium]